MQSNIEKKEAIRKFKEHKPLLGVYAVRCMASGRVWVGTSRNLDATRNGIWFSLRNGGYIDKALQREVSIYRVESVHSCCLASGSNG
jgi:hypothetical protein